MDLVKSWGNTFLEIVYPKIPDLVEQEKHHHSRGIELIASKNFSPFVSLRRGSSCLINLRSSMESYGSSEGKETMIEAYGSSEGKATVTEANNDTFLFLSENIVQSPLPRYTTSSSITLSPDDKFISYLYNSVAPFHWEVFVYDLRKKMHKPLFRPPGGEGTVLVARISPCDPGIKIGDFCYARNVVDGMLGRNIYCLKDNSKWGSMDSISIIFHSRPRLLTIDYILEKILFQANEFNPSDISLRTRFTQ